MPSKSKSQQKLFCMALAVRKGELKRSEVSQSVLDIVDGDMTDKQIKDFTVMKEHMVSLRDYIIEKEEPSIYANNFKPKQVESHKIFIIVKPGFLQYAPQIIDIYKSNGFELFETRTTLLTKNQAKKLYAMHKDEEWYNPLCEYMASDLSMGITFKYKGDKKTAFKLCSKLKDEIREKWSEDDKRNVMHSSDNYDNMLKESSFYI